jgi:hypothetical protein
LTDPNKEEEEEIKDYIEKKGAVQKGKYLF